MKDFFISYNKADRDIAEWVASQLEEDGFSVIIQAWDFHPGANFVLEMHRAVSETERTIAILSDEYLNAFYTHPEWAAAFAKDPTGARGSLIPIRARECQPKGLLAQIVYIDLVGKNSEDAKRVLLEGINVERAKTRLGSHHPIDELVSRYRSALNNLASNVRFFGNTERHSIESVFVELTILEEYERPALPPDIQGVVDSFLGSRREFFIREFEDVVQRELGMSAKNRRNIKSNELMSLHSTDIGLQAIFLGRPGCGKTTLLRYLIKKTLVQSERFPIWLELKSITEQDYIDSKGKFEELLFSRAIALQAHLRPSETENLKEYFITQLEQGRAAIFLDGLDELSGTRFFNQFCHSINEFVRSANRGNCLFISTRPYAVKSQFDGLKEMEVLPFDEHQISEFLTNYYGNDQTAKALVLQLNRHNNLFNLARVPFLLGIVAHVYRTQGKLTNGRLGLYHQIVEYLVVTLDSEKFVERFQLDDPDGTLKRDFLAHLAFARLFDDRAGTSAERLVFTYKMLVDEAKQFCQLEGIPLDQARKLAADVKATPLLREVGSSTFAFDQFTIQEYLAAESLARRDDFESVVCRSYFDHELVEMEVLPMALSLSLNQALSVYVKLKQMPESLSFVDIRLFARSLVYTTKYDEQLLSEIASRLCDFIKEHHGLESFYRLKVFNSFSEISGSCLPAISNRVIALLHTNHKRIGGNATEALGYLGGQPAEAILIELLTAKNCCKPPWVICALWQIGAKQAVSELVESFFDDNNINLVYWFKRLNDLEKVPSKKQWFFIVVRLIRSLKNIFKHRAQEAHWKAVEALGKIGSDRAVTAVIGALKHENRVVRRKAVEILGQIGTEQAIAGLLEVLRGADSKVRWRAIEALSQSRGELAISAMIEGLKDKDAGVRWFTAKKLGQTASEQAVSVLIQALNDNDSELRRTAAESLGQIGGERAMAALIEKLNGQDSYLRWKAAVALCRSYGRQAMYALIESFDDEAENIQEITEEALIEMGAGRTVVSLFEALNNNDPKVRDTAATALRHLGDERIVTSLIKAMFNQDRTIGTTAVEALGQVGGGRAIAALTIALKNRSVEIRLAAVESLGKIGGEYVVIPLCQALKDRDRDVREAAAKSLDEIDDRHIASGLQKLLSLGYNFRGWNTARIVGYYAHDEHVIRSLIRFRVKIFAVFVIILALAISISFFLPLAVPALQSLGYYVCSGVTSVALLAISIKPLIMMKTINQSINKIYCKQELFNSHA